MIAHCQKIFKQIVSFLAQKLFYLRKFFGKNTSKLCAAAEYSAAARPFFFFHSKLSCIRGIEAVPAREVVAVKPVLRENAAGEIAP